MTQPTPAPKQPRPIRDDPKAGRWDVVASWSVPPTDRVTAQDYRWAVEHFLSRRLGHVQGRRPDDLDVAVRVHGAGGEKSEDEGRWDHPVICRDPYCDCPELQRGRELP